MRCGLGLGHEDMIRRCRAASQPPDETHRGCPRRAPGASRGTAREICGAVASMGCGLSVRARGSGLLVWCFWSGGGVGRPLVLLLVWSMSVRRRSEVWERWRRSPYCHSSLLWQGGADQGACGLAVGEDSGRCLLGAGSGGPGRSMGLLRPDLGPVLPGGTGRGEGCWVRFGVDQHLSDSEGRASLEVSVTCWYWAMTASLLVGAKHGRDRGDGGLGGGPSRAGAVMLRAKRGPAALPGGPGQDRPDRGADAGVGVTGEPAPRPRGRGVRGP